MDEKNVEKNFLSFASVRTKYYISIISYIISTSIVTACNLQHLSKIV